MLRFVKFQFLFFKPKMAVVLKNFKLPYLHKGLTSFKLSQRNGKNWPVYNQV